MAMVDVGPTAPATPPEEMKTNTDMIKMSEEEAGEHSLVALISKMEWRHVMNRVEESPEDTRKKQIIKVDGVETSGYPLHLAVSLKPPRHIIDALLERHPDAIRSRDDKCGQLPLHIACIHTASAQVLRALVEGHEESLRTTDKEHGRLPLHFACLYGSPFEISLLVSAEQRALIFKDADGKTPMDLAEESSNPHREAILKRLEDRTRVVTEAMIQRRKQQQLESPPSHKTKRSSLRRAASKRGDAALSDDGCGPDDERRSSASRTKSMSHSSNSHSHNNNNNNNNNAAGAKDEEVMLKKPSGTLSRTKSMSMANGDHRRRTSRSSKSSTSGLTSEQKRQKFRRVFTTDDSDIGKKSKGSRRKTEKTKSSSRAKVTRGTSVPIVPSAEEEIDVEKTPKLRNGKDSLMARLKAEYGDDHVPRSSLGAEPLDFRNTNREKTKPRRDKLAMFLQAHAPDDSSDDDYEADHKSMGARSLPAHMQSSLSKNRHVEFEENKRIAKAYMFDDSSDDGGGGYGPRTLKRGFASDDGLATSRPHQSTPQSAELAAVEDRISNLDVRRQALSQECEAIYETVGKKEDDAYRSRDTINDLQKQIAALQERLHREQGALVLSETGIQLQKETLAVHEIKIKAVDSEKSQLIETRMKLEAEEAENASNNETDDSE